RARLIAEILNTERTYTADLEKLQQYRLDLENQNIVDRDMLLRLFANLGELLDFERRFLFQMEACLSLALNDQRIGKLFIDNEQAFSVYILFCGNYEYATQLAIDEAPTLSRAASDIDPLRGLPSYLIKPVQRVCRYPLLLKELIKLSDDAHYPHMEELSEGLEVTKRIVARVNEEKRIEENRVLKAEIGERVEDWKGLDINEFGDLLLSDKFPMASHDVEREYTIFLFERILLCCKDLAKKKKKKNSKEEETTYSLKGNINIQSISSIVDSSKPDMQQFSITVHWRDVIEPHNFSLKCRNAEQVKLWKERLE
ncbi:Dbl homology domain-containing protein, partial [Blyttiomyces helicus]